jgi:hypothetical protein
MIPEGLKFLFRYFFLLKAAADGWRIRYLGSNSFEFLKTIDDPTERIMTSKEFVERYS